MALRKSICAAAVLGFLTFSSLAFAEEVPISDQARAHFNAGVNLLQDPDGARYDEAYREFKAAYTASPSWKILGNLGIAAMKLERDGEAIEAFRKYLSEGGAQIDPEEKAQFERDAQTLEAGLVRIRVESVPAGAMIVDERIPMAGRSVINRYGPLTGSTDLGIRAGRHRITARLSGYKDVVWEFDAQSRGNYNHVFQLVKEEEAVTPTTPTPIAPAPVVQRDTTRPIPLGVYVGLGATGLLAVGGVIAGTLASSKNSDFDELNGRIQTTGDQERAEDMRDSGQRLNLVADVLFGGALVAGGVTAVLFFTRPTETTTAARKTEKPRAVKVLPSVGTRSGGLVLAGRF